MKKYQTSFLGNWSKCLSIKLCQDFPSLAHLRAQQEDFSTEAVATKTPPAEPWAGSSAICDEGKMQLCAASSWRPEEATEHLVSRMEANASQDLWRIAPSEDMAAQTNARMEGEDPGLTTCISLLEEVSNTKAGIGALVSICFVVTMRLFDHLTYTRRFILLKPGWIWIWPEKLLFVMWYWLAVNDNNFSVVDQNKF